MAEPASLRDCQVRRGQDPWAHVRAPEDPLRAPIKGNRRRPGTSQKAQLASGVGVSEGLLRGLPGRGPGPFADEEGGVQREQGRSTWLEGGPSAGREERAFPCPGGLRSVWPWQDTEGGSYSEQC